jgi:hypothetical protein
MTLKPSLNDDLAFCEEANRLLALGMQHSKKGVFHSAEWEEGHRSDNPNIDADIPAGHVILEFPCTPSILGKDRMTVPKGACIAYLNRFS